MAGRKIRSNTAVISAGFWFVFFLFAFFYLTAYLNIARIDRKLKDITDIAFPIAEMCDELIITLENANKLSREILLETDINTIELLEKKFEGSIRLNYDAQEKIFRLSAKDRKLKDYMIEAEKKIDAFVKYAKSLFSVKKNDLARDEKPDPSVVIKLLDKKVKNTNEHINSIIEYADSILNRADEGAKGSITTTHTIMLALFLGSLVVGLLITLWVNSSILQAEKLRNIAFNEIDQIWNTASVGMCLISRDYIITRVNETFMKMFRLKERDIVGAHYSELWEMFNSHFSEKMYRMIIDEKTNFESEKVISLDEQNELVCLVKSVPFMSGTGLVTGILESFIDITEKKSIEKDIMKAIESERQRIGRDLHDSLGQQLTGLSYLNQAIRNSLREKSYDVLEEVDESIKIISELIAQTRTLSKGLHPVELDRFGLVMALNELALDTERIFDISCEVIIRDEMRFNDPVTELNLYYIVKEAVNNSIKHGDARIIRILFQKEDGYTKLEILDDGKGNNYPDSGHEGIGLRTMKFRASIIGADFHAAGTSEGFKVRLLLKS